MAALAMFMDGLVWDTPSGFRMASCDTPVHCVVPQVLMDLTGTYSTGCTVHSMDTNRHNEVQCVGEPPMPPVFGSNAFGGDPWLYLVGCPYNGTVHVFRGTPHSSEQKPSTSKPVRRGYHQTSQRAELQTLRVNSRPKESSSWQVELQVQEPSMESGVVRIMASKMWKLFGCNMVTGRVA